MANPLGSFSSFSSSSMLLSLSLVLLLITSSFSLRPSLATLDRSFKAADDEIQDVCRYTQDPNYCATALKSHPQSPQADLPGLAKIAVDLAYKMALDANLYALAIVQNGTSPELQRRYLLCSDLLLDARENIKEARDDLKSNDYIDVSSAALEATEEAQGCQVEFEMPPPEPSQLPQMITKLVTLYSAIFFIAGRLIRNT